MSSTASMRGGGQASLGQVSFTKTISMGTHYFDYYVDDGSMCHALPDTDTQVQRKSRAFYEMHTKPFIVI